MTQEELVEWLKEYRLNLMSLMGQDDYVTGKLDVIKDVLDKCNTKDEATEMLRASLLKQVNQLSDDEIISLYDNLSKFFNTKEK